MKVSSFIRTGHELVMAEVELTLAPGLPQFSFVGLPDLALRESGLRVRSALREQEFDLPSAHQILVHIKPTFLKKTSRGLDLAIACALLWETGQLALPDETPVLYGELTLKGEVVQPDDLSEAPEHLSPVVTGPSADRFPFASRQIANLASMKTGGTLVGASETFEFVRPSLKIRKLPREAAEFAKVVATGEHSILLAGPPGTGKSTFADALASWVEAPTFEQLKEVRHFWPAKSKALTWRPVLKPHHSVTPLAMIGGGASLWPGEITRAHGGILIMDELLEFHSDIQEALREPVESGHISLVRAGASRTYPAQVLLIGTTNLCACGGFVPRKKRRTECRCAKSTRSKMLARLTGPFVDRFALIALTDVWDEDEQVSVEDVTKDVEQAISFRRARGQSVPNSRLAPEVIEDGLSDFEREHLVKTAARSRRRRSALLRVARTLADLRSDEKISPSDLEKARLMTTQSHRLLEEWSD